MSTLLVIIVVILGIVALAQLIRVFELASKLKGTVDPGEVPDREIRANAMGMLLFVIVFMAYTIGLTVYYSDKLLPISASEHGETLDVLLYFNFAMIGIVFIITHILLFGFAYKYAYRKDRVATYFTHSNKLELIWTIVPAIFLAVIIVFGLTTWNNITAKAPADALTVELYSQQFAWTARYPGADTTLGASSYLFATSSQIGMDPDDPAGQDDILVTGEFHIPKGKHVNFVLRSQDVIHSAYMPHFRAQMNSVPGMITNFHFMPIMSTEDMRKETGDPEFNYYLLCNKICGAAHYNMKMIIVVDETEEAYNTWLAAQKTFGAKPAADDATELGAVVEPAAAETPEPAAVVEEAGQNAAQI